MPSDNCNDLPINVPITLGIYSTDCNTSPSTNSSSISYQGADLTCSEIFSGNSLDVVIQKLDSKLCGVLGDFSSYNTYCLVNSVGEPILNQQQFVEASSKAICDLEGEFHEFRDIIFDGYENEVNTRFKLIEVPGIISTTQGILSTSTIQNTISILSSSIDDILNTKLNISSVAWNSCYTISPIPITLAQGFSALQSEICSIKADVSTSSSSLPTFNNIGSSLPSPVTSSDTLVSTINKIKTRVDQIPTFDINALSWGCTTKPSSSTYNLQSAFQSILNTTNDYKQNKLSFSSDFIITPTGVDSCNGLTVALAISSSLDRNVASNNSDTSPGTLFQKLQAGSGMSLDFISTPGKVIFNNTGSVNNDKYVRVNVSDITSGYLEDKIEVATNSSGISITKATNDTSHKVALNTSINLSALWNSLLTFLDSNPSTYAEFCQRVSDCLPDCVVPPSVTVIYDTPTTSSTTSTTTTL